MCIVRMPSTDTTYVVIKKSCVLIRSLPDAFSRVEVVRHMRKQLNVQCELSVSSNELIVRTTRASDVAQELLEFGVPTVCTTYDTREDRVN